MSDIVLDASAILAFINAEPGAEKLTTELLSSAVVSAVNAAEVQSKLVRDGVDPSDAWELATGITREVAPFTASQARIAGELILQTGALGLSLGDRACMALGTAKGAPVYTTDRSWKSMKLSVQIHVLR